MELSRVTRRSNGMHIQTWGTGGATAVFVHGWLVNGDVYEPLCKELQLDGAVTIPDLAGTGRSDTADETVGLASWQSDLVGLLRAEPRPVHLVGHSMGGLLAQMVAIDAPELVASLTLIVPVLTQGFPLSGDVKGLFESAVDDIPSRRIVMDASCVDPDDTTMELLHRVVKETEASAARNGLRDWQAGIPGADLSRIRCPTLVIGSDDAFLSNDLLQDLVVGKIRGAKFSRLPNAGHYPLVQRPADLARIMESFIGAL